MAIFYEHIKGCNKDNSYTSWIEWSNTALDTTSPLKKAEYLPQIYIGNSKASLSNFGRIITSDAVNQEIKNPLKTNNLNSYYIWVGNKMNSGTPHIYYNSGVYIQSYNETGGIQPLQLKGESIEVWTEDSNKTSINQILINKDNTTIYNKLEVKKSIHAKEIISTDKDIKATGKCQANYFNATSDARAKSNITPAQFSALDVIKQLPIYTFNYLNDPKLSVGLIAQEAAEYDLDGFNMVDNLDAEGAFGDFMQIKESKLVYVLWKAVQELSAEVESLKAQLNNK